MKLSEQEKYNTDLHTLSYHPDHPFTATAVPSVWWLEQLAGCADDVLWAANMQAEAEDRQSKYVEALRVELKRRGWL